MKLMAKLPRAALPGTVNNYSTGETQVAGEIVRSAVGGPLADYLSDRIWSRYAMEADARWWLDSPNGHEIGGSGFSATLRDYGRFGQFILDGGTANGEQILPKGWIEEASTPKDAPQRRCACVRLLLVARHFSRAASRSAFEAVGIFGQHIYINPAVHLVIVIWGAQTLPTGGAIIDDWKFFDAVAEQMNDLSIGAPLHRLRLQNTTHSCIAYARNICRSAEARTILSAPIRATSASPAFLFDGKAGSGPGPHRHPYDEIQFIREGRGATRSMARSSRRVPAISSSSRRARCTASRRSAKSGS